MAKDKITYTGPAPSGVTMKVTLKPGPHSKSDAPFPHEYGVMVKTSLSKAIVLSWDDVACSLRWALERSPELRADVRRMLDLVELDLIEPPASVDPIGGP